MLAALRRHYGPFRHSRVIYNARDPKLFSAEGKARLVFASGRLWDEAKNLQAVEAIAPQLAWPIYLAGENRSPDGGEALAGNTRYLGRLAQPEIAHWFSRAAIFLHPARYEPFGLCVLEAALSGCAMVLGDIPSLRELWEGAAEFVDPEDHAGLQRAVTGLIENPDYRHRLGGAAQALAGRFRPARMAQDYMKTYQALINEREPATMGGLQR
jgi:glycosyltransferase involved in cell wall biosynthesis